MTIHEGDGWRVVEGDCVEAMGEMDEASVDCAIFSPPFSDLFVYSDSDFDMGNCATHAEFMEHYAFFADALARVIKPGRMACVHCTDLPLRKQRDGVIGVQDFPGDLIRAHEAAGMIYHARATVWKDPVVEMQRTKALGLLYKQLKKDSCMSRVGLPDYVLFFRAPGDNPDRVTHEEADLPVTQWQELASPVWMTVDQGRVLNGALARSDRDERHICPLQLDVIERCLRLYTNPGDLVLDPFNGIGSTGFQALKMDRRYAGIELKPEYAALAAKFLRDADAQGRLL